jgi:hypothetical protein
MTTPVTTRRDFEAELRRLADHDEPNSYSIFIPTHRTHPETEQDPIRFKNALDGVAGLLEAGGLGSRRIEAALAPLRNRLSDRTFWQHRNRGLAVFGSIDTSPVEIDLGFSPAQQTRVGRRFHVRPLISELDEFIVPVLALQRGAVAFYEMDDDGVHRVECDLPDSMSDVNWFVDRESRLQQRPQPPGGDGGAFHGHDPEEDEGEDLRRYLEAVTDEIGPMLKDRSVPLVVSAPGDLSSRLGSLLEHEIVSRPAVDSVGDANQIAEKLSDARSQLLELRRSERRSNFADALGRGETIQGLHEVLRGAASGQVEALAVVPDGAPMWGRFDEATMDLVVHDERQDGDDDLVDRMIGLTLSRGGSVHPIERPIGDRAFVATTRFDTAGGDGS